MIAMLFAGIVPKKQPPELFISGDCLSASYDYFKARV
jgi:hypothetical protein